MATYFGFKFDLYSKIYVFEMLVFEITAKQM